jgi:hypothetical protein
MWMDIRWPIGLFFSAVGALLAVYGLASSSANDATSLGINVNLEWGGVLLVFGLIMCFLGRRWGRPGESEGSSSVSPPDHRGSQ